MAKRNGVIKWEADKALPGIERAQLRNGLLVLHVPLPNAKKTVVMLGVKVGSACEPRRLGGISHFIEHLAFKSTPRFSCAEMARRVDSLGGSLNAFTDTVATVFELRAPSATVTRGISVLFESVVNDRFDRREFERERGVVLTEITGNLESPDDYARTQLYLPALFGDAPFARPIDGRPEVVERLTLGEVGAWKARHYRPENAVLAVAGSCERAALGDAIGETFGRWKGKGGSTRTSSSTRTGTTATAKGKKRAIERWEDMAQVYLMLGVRTPSHRSRDAAALALLSAVLGLGPSSRLFRLLRDDRGIGYDVVAEWESLGPAGHLVAAIPGFDPARFGEAERLIRRELLRLVTELVPRGELDKAKALILAGHDDALESPIFHAESLIYREILGLTDDHRELKPRIDAVDSERLRAVAARIFRHRPTVAALGPRDADW